VNTLNRRMFADGDVAVGQPQQPQPKINIPELIGYYVSQGYNSAEINEMLPDVPFGDIEAMVSQLGGSVNPGVASPNANEFTGDINPFVQIPETTVTSNQAGMTTMNPSNPVGATPPELPSLNDISIVPEEIRNYIEKASKVLDEENLIQGLKISFGLSEDEARSMIGMSLKPSTDIDMIDPSIPSAQDLLPIDDGLPEISDIGTSSGLGANQYRNAEGKLFTIDPVKFKEVLMSENIKELEALIQNPDVEYGPALQEVFRQIVGKRKAGFSSTSPSTFEFGEFLPDPLSLKSGIEDAGGFALDYGKQIVEGAGNLFGGFMSDRDGVQDTFPSERFDFNKDTYFSDPTIGFSPSGNKRKGYTNEALDGIILRSSLGEIDQSLEEIAAAEAKPIEEKAKEKDAGDGTKEVAGKEAEDAKKAGASTDPTYNELTDNDTLFDTEEEDDIPGMTPGTPNDEAEQLLTIFDRVGGFINSEANLRMMRNVGKGLTQYGNLSQGIGIGSAAASEERQLQETLDAKTKAELAIKKAELEASGEFSVTDREKILDVQTGMNKSVRTYNNAVAAETLVDEVLRFANGNDDLTSFASKIGATVDDLLVAASLKKGDNVSKMSDTKRAQIALDILTNANIKEILGESGRTISNIDRDIANRIAGNLNMKSIQSIGELKTRLQNNLLNITEKKNEAQRNIKSSVRFLTPYDPEAIDDEIFFIFINELGMKPPPGYSQESSDSSPETDGIFIDAS